MSFPTQLTVLRILLVPVFFVLFAVVEPSQTIWAGIVFLIAALSDWYDGYFARAFNLTTPLGAFLDPLADKFLTGAALLAFNIQGLIPLWMVIVIVLRDVYMTLFRMYGDAVGKSVRTNYFAKVKTVIQMVFISVVLLALCIRDGLFGAGLSGVGSALTDVELLTTATLVVTLVTIASAVQYTYHNWALLLHASRSLLMRRTV